MRPLKRGSTGSAKLVVLLLLVAAIVALVVYGDLGRLLSLDNLKSRRDEFQQFAVTQPLLTSLVYFAVYVAVTAFSLPGAAILTLAGGAIFGFGWGLVLVSFASTLGACCAFLAARWLLRDSIRSRFGERLAAVEQGIAKEGAFYLFTLRLIPAVPFFLVNLLGGLTPLRLFTFAWVSQLGMLPGTAVYVNAGTQIANINSLSGIVSPQLWLSFVLLAVFPFISRSILGALKTRKKLSAWKKPARFDYNIVVIGAGAAGLVTSYIAAVLKARVLLIEKHEMGGDCLNTGCVPSKALIRTAKLVKQIQNPQTYGISAASATVNFSDVMARVHQVIKDIEPHDSVERYTSLGVECAMGNAELLNPWEIKVTAHDGSSRVVSAKNIVLATGARPFVPTLPGLLESDYYTSDTVWSANELPRRLVVLGGGPIGCELAQCFVRLGSQVIQVDMAPRIMPREDEEVSNFVMSRFREEGIEILTAHQAVRVEGDAGERRLVLNSPAGEVAVAFDKLLIAIGRVARTEGFGLEKLGIGLSPQKTIAVNEFLETELPHIYVCGDAAGPYQFTHFAAHQAWYASVNALFKGVRRFAVDMRVVPAATYVDPEVARVGLNEQEAKAKGIAYEVTRYGLDDLDRAIADSEAHGFVKVLTPVGKDTILGVTIVGSHAGELLAEWTLAMKHGLGLGKIMGTIHAYPTWAESAKYAAGEYRKARQPLALLAWLQKFHAWRRGA
ncbi:MAG: FAD-dependent oxidoreductase [Burkholderiales bacterium]|nr:FAD-dependent oxidoreductase [Burkholderiales bacterium]